MGLVSKIFYVARSKIQEILDNRSERVLKELNENYSSISLIPISKDFATRSEVDNAFKSAMSGEKRPYEAMKDLERYLKENELPEVRYLLYEARLNH